MKRRRDEEKIMGPMFPRLHVNDADKGGPRAPPRNKMALYEQLSIPSQRFSHAATHNAANLAPRPNQADTNKTHTSQLHELCQKKKLGLPIYSSMKWGKSLSNASEAHKLAFFDLTSGEGDEDTN